MVVERRDPGPMSWFFQNLKMCRINNEPYDFLIITILEKFTQLQHKWNYFISSNGITVGNMSVHPLLFEAPNLHLLKIR